MRICIYLENYVAGGVDTVIVNKMNEWPDNNDEIVLICNGSHDGLKKMLKKQIRRSYGLILSPTKTFPDTYNKHSKYFRGNRILRVPFKFFWFCARYVLFVYNIRKLQVLFKRLKPDGVFIHNGGYPGADTARGAVAGAALAGVKKVFMILHNLAARPKSYALPMEYIIDRIVDRYSKIICVSRASREILLKNRSIVQDILVIHNGVAFVESLSRDKSLELKSDLGLPPESSCIGMIGSYDERKGHEDLFEALDVLRTEKKLNGIKCLVFGKGSSAEEERLKKLICEKVFGDEIFLCGFRSDVLKYFCIFDVFVLPSRDYESLPMVILEAMSFGVPVVAADVGGVREMVKDGVTGFLIPPGSPDILADRLEAMLNNEGLRDQMVEAAKAECKERFTATGMAKRYYDLMLKR